MRAVAEDQQAAQSVGISIKRVFGMSWAISCTTAAIAGIILATMLSVVYTIADVGLASISAVLLGGLESLAGGILGGLIIGVIQNLCEGYLGGSISGIGEIAPYLILLLILLIKPYGLFGLKRIERV
jgi:branched-chain amino acid transport system permease protein